MGSFPNPILNPNKLVSSLPAADISGFFEAVNLALTQYLLTSKWPAGTQPTFIHTFPKQRLTKADDPFDVITFSVGGAEMAPTSNDESRVPIRPIIRETRPSKTQLGYVEKVYAWKEVVAVVFTIWSKSNARADDMTNWWHRFIMKYAHVYEFFRARGVDRFEFVKRGRDETDLTQEQEVYKRSLVYKFRIEYIDVALEKTLENVHVNVSLKEPGATKTELIDTFDIPTQQP